MAQIIGPVEPAPLCYECRGMAGNCVTMVLVAVVPAAEYAALQRLREDVEDDALADNVAGPDGLKGTWGSAIEAYRAALKRRMEEP